MTVRGMCEVFEETAVAAALTGDVIEAAGRPSAGPTARQQQMPKICRKPAVIESRK
jgi:hypothetical protein